MNKVQADRELPQTLEWQWVLHVSIILGCPFWRMIATGLEDFGSAF